MTIILVSNSDDGHVDSVSHHLNVLEIEYHRLNTEEFGDTLGLALQFGSNNQLLILSDNGKTIDLSSITAVWYRRPQIPKLSFYDLDPIAQSFALDQWGAALGNINRILSHAFFVSDPSNIARSSHKAWQLKFAQTHGFQIPETLITNDQDKLKEFIEQFDNLVVVKALGRAWVEIGNLESSNKLQFIYTNRIHGDDLERIQQESIKVAPIICQNLIPKRYEIRVTVVGQRVFAIKIDSQASDISQLDWRRYDLAHTPYTSYDLPSAVEDQCLNLVADMGLEYSTIDLIRTPDGAYVFLEVNCNGQFLWAEDLSGVPISNSIARLLAGLDPPLQKRASDNQINI